MPVSIGVISSKSKKCDKCVLFLRNLLQKAHKVLSKAEAAVLWRHGDGGNMPMPILAAALCLAHNYTRVRQAFTA